jgi:Tol biopolymer transport system component
MNPDGTNKTRIPNTELAGLNSWSPDGTKLVFQAEKGYGNLSSGLFLINLDGTNRQLITNGNNNDDDAAARWQPLPNVSPIVSATTRLSLTNGNRQANADSYAPALSTDGRYIAFASDAINLVSGDTNGATDIFLRDRVTQTVKLVTKSGNGDSLRPAISANGRYIAYESYASNLVEGDTNNAADIFRYDRITGTTVRASVASGGAQGNSDSISAVLSDDGNRVAFASSASNLVSGDTNGAFDVFVRDVTGDSTMRASVGLANAQGDGDSVMPALSGDGRYVAFASGATNLVEGDTNASYDIFRRDMQDNATLRVSVRNGASALQANRDSWQPQISADGSLVVFASDASNLVASDRNQVTDIFLRNFAANATYRVSRTDQIKEAKAASYRPRLSGSGRYVAFQSDAALTAADTNQAMDVYLFDRTAQKLARVSVATDGTQGDGQSLAPAISGDGGYVVFESDSTNLVKGDTNQAWDIF